MYSMKKIYVIFALKCMSSGQKNTTGIIVPFNSVPFNFVLKSCMSWHCFELKRTDMHVSEFLNAKCLVEVTPPVTFVDVLWSLFHLLTGMSHKVFGYVSVFCQKDRGGNASGNPCKGGCL